MSLSNQDQDFVNRQPFLPHNERSYSREESSTNIRDYFTRAYDVSCVSSTSPLPAEPPIESSRALLNLNTTFFVSLIVKSKVLNLDSDFEFFEKKGVDLNHYPNNFTSSTKPIFQELSTKDQIVNLVCEGMSIGYFEEIKSRLLSLSSYDLEEGETPISVGSIRYFIGFLKEIRPVKPSIVITPFGYVQAQWKESNSNLLTIVFKPEGEVSFVVFRENSRNTEIIKRLSGVLLVDEIISSLESFDIDRLLHGQNAT